MNDQRRLFDNNVRRMREDMMRRRRAGAPTRAAVRQAAQPEADHAAGHHGHLAVQA